MLRILRVAIRTIAVVLLLVAAVVHGAGANEYPGITRPSLRFLATAVLPLLAVAVLNVIAFGSNRRSPVWRALALASSASLLAASLPHVERGAPPVFIALPILSALLLALGATLEILMRRRTR